MGKRGPQSKNPAVRQRKNAELRALPGDRIDLSGKYPQPAGQPKWFKATRDAWDAFWGSDVAGGMREKDVAALVRLFDLRNLHERLFRVVNAEPVVAGSRNNDVLNPAAGLMTKLMSEIRQLEREFGLTPDSGARMVSAAAGAERSVRDLLNAGDADDRPVIVAVDSDTGS